MKTYKGIKNPQFLPIIKNRDESGHILTYTVKFENFELEFNTIGKAKLMALVVGD